MIEEFDTAKLGKWAIIGFVVLGAIAILKWIGDFSFTFGI
jgi:hypothetical protein